MRLELREAYLSAGGGDRFGSSTAAELLLPLVSFRLFVRSVAKTSPMIPQYETSAFSNWADDSRKAKLIP